jgi:hypothetical protein
MKASRMKRGGRQSLSLTRIGEHCTVIDEQDRDVSLTDLDLLHTACRSRIGSLRFLQIVL